MKFKQFMAFINDQRKIYDQNPNSRKYEEIRAHYKSSYITTKGINGIFDKIGKSVSIDDITSKIMPSFKGEEYDKVVKSFLYALYNQTNSKIKDNKGAQKLNDIRNDKKLSSEEKFNKSIEAFKDICKNNPDVPESNKNEAFINAFSSSQKNIFNSFTKEEDIKRFQEVYNLDDSKLDEFVPEETIYLTPDEIPGIDNIKYKDEQIKLMIESMGKNATKEDVKLLEDCNNILIKAKGQFTSVTSDIAEEYGKASEYDKADEIVEYYVNNGYKADEIDNFKGIVSFTKQSPNIKEEIFNDIKEVNIPKKQKDDIKSIVNDMEEWGIFVPGNFEAESGSKAYAFNALAKAQVELENAVDSGDLDKIKESRDKYRDLEAKYDNILDRLSKINNNKQIASNISPARESYIPTKYRDNPIAASRISGLWLALGFYNAADVDFNEALDNPVKVNKEIASKILSSKSYFNKEINKDKSDLKTIIHHLDKKKDGKYNSASDKDVAVGAGFLRAFDGVSVLLSGKEKIQYDAELNKLMKSSCETSVNIANDGLSKGLGDNPKQFIKNMIVASGDDFNFYKLNPNANTKINPDGCKYMDAFDPQTYIALKGNSKEMIDKMYNLTDFGKIIDSSTTSDLNKNVIDAIKETSTLIMQTKQDLSQTEKSILNKMSSGIKPKESLMAQYRYESLGLNNDSPSQEKEAAVKAYAEIKNDYNKRSFFAKIFFSSVRNQKKYLTTMKQNILSTGVKEDRFNEIVNGYQPTNSKEAKIHDYQNDKSIKLPQSPELAAKLREIEERERRGEERGLKEREKFLNGEKVVVPIMKKNNKIISNLNQKGNDQIDLQDKLSKEFDNDLDMNVSVNKNDGITLEINPLENTK